MNKHKEKCNHLKAIRKNMADALGVELSAGRKETFSSSFERNCGGNKCGSYVGRMWNRKN